MVIEETEETEYFKDRRIQVSIFMNIFNVHINWFPVNGIIKYFKYHKGNFAAAYLPKSSTENERTTIVIESNNGQTILMRQIAGAMAKRIVSYAPVSYTHLQHRSSHFLPFSLSFFQKDSPPGRLLGYTRHLRRIYPLHLFPFPFYPHTSCRTLINCSYRELYPIYRRGRNDS